MSVLFAQHFINFQFRIEIENISYMQFVGIFHEKSIKLMFLNLDAIYLTLIGMSSETKNNTHLQRHLSIFYKTQKGWQGVKLTRLMSIFTSNKVWKFLMIIQLTKSDPKRTRVWKVPCLMPIRVNICIIYISNSKINQNIYFGFSFQKTN